MTTTPTKTPILGNDEASRRYEEALAKLTESLDDRKRLFDPTLLAMAQGFFAPTQTGGFGESMGNAAKNVGAAQEAEDKRNQEMLQQKVALAGQGVEMSRSKANEKAVQDWLKSQGDAITGPQSAPINGPLSQAAPEAPSEPPQEAAGALSQATPSASPSAPPSAPAAGPLTVATAPPSAPARPTPPAGFEGGRQIMPPNPAYMTQKEYVALNAGKGIPIGELLAKGAEIERHGMDKTEGAMVNKRTGMAYSIKDQIVDYPIYGEGYGGKTYKVSEQDAMRLSQLQREKNYTAYKELADTATGANFGKAPAGQTSAAQPSSGKPSASTPVDNSVEGRALAQEQAKELAKAKTSQEIEDRRNFVQRGREADDTITLAGQFRKFAADPSAAKMAGILNDNKISSGVARLVQDGIGSGTFRVGVPQIEDVMRNAGLDRDQQAKYRTFLMLTVESQLLKTKYMKGSISNYEDKLLGNAGINAQDTPETIRMKADLFTRRAQFDRRVAKEFKNSKMTADEFLDSDKYSEMRDKYNADLADLSFGGKALAPTAKPVKGNKNLDAARARVDDLLRNQ
jgi:hypothetical protein